MKRRKLIHRGFNVNTKNIVLDEITANFLKNFRAIRKNLGFTQEQLANAAGINRTTVLAFEKGYACPSLAVLIKLAKILKTDISESINYKFFHRKIKPEQIKEAMRSYNLSYAEISKLTGYCPECVSYSARLKPNASIHCLYAVLQVIHREKIASVVRDSLTRSPKNRNS